MSKYSLEYCTDRELPEWLVVCGYRVVFKSPSKEEAECMLQECQYFERAEEEYEIFNNQQSEWDLYGDNAFAGE